MSRSRISLVLAAATVVGVAAAALLLHACDGDSSAVPDADPTYVSLLAEQPSPAEIRDALDRDEYVVREQPVRLVPPVDWLQDPYGNLSWQFWLHSWVFMEPLLQHYDTTRDFRALHKAADLAIDWISSNPQGENGLNHYAWYDMSAGIRAAYLGYLYRALWRTDRDDPRLEPLLASAVEHGRWLVDPDNFAEAHNHGLFQAAGLRVLAQQLSFRTEAPMWRLVSTLRFGDTVARTVSLDDAIHLEHSTEYHFAITTLLERLEPYFGDAQSKKLVQRMKANAGWFVLPDGYYAQIGDTHRTKAPTWYREAGAHDGVVLFEEAGYGVVKQDGTYLIMASGFHRTGHKHADELTVSWFDGGRRILVDSGKYGYYDREPGRIYAISSPAHNTLVRSDAPFAFDGQPAYGSGMVAAGRRAGWFALLGVNPLAVATDYEHERLVLLRPGVALVILDRVTPREPIRVARHFHFAPDYELEVDGTTAVGRTSDGASLRMVFPDAAGLEVYRGQKEPEIRGFTFPATRKWVPNADLVVSDELNDTAVLCAAFLLGEPATPMDVACGWQGDAAWARLGDAEVNARIRDAAIDLTSEKRANDHL